MHLPEGAYNLTIAAIWTSFSEDRRDKRTDNLPMMDSIVWPIGVVLVGLPNFEESESRLLYINTRRNLKQKS